MDQSTMTLKWEKPVSGAVDFFDTVARTTVVNPQDRQSNIGQEAEQADLNNTTHLEKLISEHPEFCLVIEHDVMVNSTVRRLRYRVNLIEVICRALASYSTLESAAKGTDALCAHKHSLRAIVCLALCLRYLMEKPVEDLNANSDVPWKHNTNTKAKRGRPLRNGIASPTASNSYNLPNYIFTAVRDIGLDNLQPPPSKQKEILNQMVLNLTDEEFNAKSFNGNIQSVFNDSVGVAVVANQGGRIEADESQGVFGF